MARRTRRPRPWSVGSVRIRAIRGPHPEKGWYFRAEEYRDGKSFTLWTGWHTDPGKVTMQVAGLVADGETAEPGRRSQTARFDRVTDLMEYWVAAQELRGDLSPRTKKLARSQGRKITRVIGDVILSRLDITVLETYRDARLHEGSSTQGLFEELKAIRRAYKWAQQRGLVDTRPLSMPQLKVRPKLEKVTPTRDEFWQVHAWIAQNSRRSWRAHYLQVLASTGCRADEAAELRWSHIDLKRKVLHIDGKTDRRDVVITDTLVALLKSMKRAGDPRVFGVSPRTIKGALGTWMRDNVPWDELGIRRFTPQGVRRMVVDQLYASGSDIGVVSQHLGHSPAVALKFYRQATKAQTVRALALAGIGEKDEPDVVPIFGSR